MRYFALFFTLVFTWFAYLQLNDPDAIWWTTLYLIPAYFSYRAFRNKYSPETLKLLIIIYSAYMVSNLANMTAYEGFFTAGQGMEMKTPNQEYIREASGLMICIVVFLIYSVKAVRQSASAPPITKKVYQEPHVPV